MSYEGYLQNICENGHRYNCENNLYYDDTSKCPICKTYPAFSNAVDETNCDSYGFVPDTEWEKLLYEKEVRQTCNLGCDHVIKHATYLIPCEGGPSKPLRYYCRDKKWIQIT